MVRLRDVSENRQLKEAGLLAQIARKNGEAFRSLYQEWWKPAFALAFRITRNRALAEEAVQDAFLQVWQKASLFDPQRGSLKAWLLHIVANKSNRVCGVRKGEARRIACRYAVDEEVEERKLPADALEQKEEAAGIRLALKNLPVSDQRLLGMYYGDGLRQKQIGDVLSLSQRGVSHRLREALCALEYALGRVHQVAKGLDIN